MEVRNIDVGTSTNTGDFSGFGTSNNNVDVVNKSASEKVSYEKNLMPIITVNEKEREVKTEEAQNIFKSLVTRFPEVDEKQIGYYIDLYYVAFDVIKGEYSVGEKRQELLEAEGYNYEQVRRMVNRILDKLNSGYSFENENQITNFLYDTINYDTRLLRDIKARYEKIESAHKEIEASDKKIEATGENNFVKSFVSILSKIFKSIPFFHGGEESSATTAVESPATTAVESSATTAVESNEPIPQISVKTQELEELRKGLIETGLAEFENRTNTGDYKYGEWCVQFVDWIYLNTYYGDKSAAEIAGITDEAWTSSTGRMMLHFLTASDPGEEKLGIKYKDKQYFSPNDNIAFYYNDSCEYYAGMNSDKLPEGTSVYIPKPGDYVFMDTKGPHEKWTPVETPDYDTAPGTQEHTGMVTRVISDDNGNQWIEIIEGNYNETHNTRRIQLNDSEIIGYGTITNLP